MKYGALDELNVTLDRWALKKREEIFVIEGPSQVGKTRFIKTFIQYKASSTFYVDVKINKALLEQLLLDTYLTADNFYSSLCFSLNYPYYQNLTLLIFDGIEYCPRLRQFFKTLVKCPFINIVAISCGGLRKMHYGNYLTPSEEQIHYLYPLDFADFLRAIGKEQQLSYAGRLIASCQPVSEYVSADLYRLFKLYNLIGGYPSVIETYNNTNDISKCILMNREIFMAQVKHAKDLLDNNENVDLIVNNILRIVEKNKFNSLESLSPFKTKNLISFLEEEYIFNIATAYDLTSQNKLSSSKKLLLFHQSYYYALDNNFDREHYLSETFPSKKDILTDFYFNQRINNQYLIYGLIRNKSYLQTDALSFYKNSLIVVEVKEKRLTFDVNFRISDETERKIKPGIVLLNSNYFNFKDVCVLPSYCSSFIDNYLFESLEKYGDRSPISAKTD